MLIGSNGLVRHARALGALRLGREKDDGRRRRGRVGLQPPTRFVAVESGHHPVEHERVERRAPRAREELDAGLDALGD